MGSFPLVPLGKPADIYCAVLSHSVVSDSFETPARILCPWGFSRQEYWVGFHALLQGILLTQGSNPGLLHCRWVLYHLSHQGSPFIWTQYLWKVDKVSLILFLCSWDSPGKSTGVGCHGLLQGSSWSRDQTASPALQVSSVPTEPPGKPLSCTLYTHYYSNIILYLEGLAFNISGNWGSEMLSNLSAVLKL